MIKSKKLKEYFLEFAMIFLAVVLSFFAENYRESIADRRQEKQLIRSLVEDLKSDTLNIRRALNSRQRKLKWMDSLMLLLESKQIKGHENDLYFYTRNLIRAPHFQSNERTISQIKESGVSEMIQNKEVLNRVILYHSIVAMLVLDHENERLEQRAAFPVLSQMFDSFIFDKMVNGGGIKLIRHCDRMTPKFNKTLPFGYIK
ncbi:MAG: hypothetical protein QM734_07795 [Cyclobacteriaceae bacterium]